MKLKIIRYSLIKSEAKKLQSWWNSYSNDYFLLIKEGKLYNVIRQ